MRQEIVVLGGGLAGATAAFAIQRKLRRRHAVKVVSEKKLLEVRQSLPRVAFGIKKSYNATVDLGKALEEKGVAFEQASVQEIDARKKTLETSSGTVSYGCLLLALGASWLKEKVAGWQHAHYLNSLESALEARNSLKEFSGNALVSATCSGNEWEGPALEAIFHARQYFSSRGVDATLHYVTHKKRPMQELGSNASNAVERELEAKRIVLHAQENVEEVLEKKVKTSKKMIESDFTFIFPPYAGNHAIAESGLGDEKGFLKVDGEMRVRGEENVFAAGDCVNGLSVKLGFNAISGAIVAGENVAAQLQGKPLKKFEPKIVYAMELGGGEGLLFNARLKNGEWHSRVTRGAYPFAQKLSFEKTLVEKNGFVNYVLGEKV